MNTHVEYLGRCHCGALTARYRTAVPPSQWPIRACQCAFCRAHATLTTSDPAGTLLFAARDAARVHRYRFDSRTADFLICSDCGVFLGARISAVRGEFGVLNVRALRPLLELPPARPVEFGPESAGERTARRLTSWTPVAAGSL